MKYFAIGFGEWVEIREGTKSPKVSTSEVNRGIQKIKMPTGEQWVDAYGNMRMKVRTVEVPITIKMVTYIGGKVLCALSANRFYGFARTIPNKDGMIEIDQSVVKKILDWKGMD